MDYAQKPKIYSADGSLEKRWHIVIYVPEPNHPGKFRRLKKYCDINKETTYTARMRRAKHHLKIFENLLDSGWTPIEEENSSLKSIEGTKRYTVKECIEIYLPYTKSVLAEPTYRKYLFYLNHFQQWPSTPIYMDEIKKQTVLDFLAYKRSNWGNKMCNNFKTDFSTFLNYWVDNYEEVLAKNPITKMNKLPEEVEGNTAYSDTQIAELKKLMLADDPYMFFICQVIYNTCTRPQAETRQLKCGDFDFVRKQLRIDGRIAKNNSRGYVPLSDEFIKILKEHGIEAADPEHYLLTADRKPGPHAIAGKTMAKRYKKYKDALGLKSRSYSLYGWKHTRNVHAWMSTKDIMFIKTLNRHKTLEMTMRYLRDLGCFVDNNELVNQLGSI
jgi:integrase